MANLDTDSPVIWPKWCYNNRPKNDKGVSEATVTKTPLSNKTRRKKIARSNASSGVKRERCTPEMEIGTGSSRSGSPYSPNSHSFQPQTPSNTEMPNNSCFSPPERFSPGNQNIASSKLMSEGLQMSRNYSDFMRSLAAKYNNSNPNDYQAQQTSSLISLMDSRSSCKELVSGEGSSQTSTFPLFNIPMSSFTSNAIATRKHSDLASTGSGSGKKERKEEFFTIPVLPLCGLVQDTNMHQGLPPGFPSNSTMDMSSTQALLSIVRSATARNAQQINTYFGGLASTQTSTTSLKRTAETVGIASQTPLDLSASVAKRPYVETQAQSIIRNRFHEHPSARTPTLESDTLLKRQYSPTDRKSPSRFVANVITAYVNANNAEKKVTAQNTVSIAQHASANCHLSCAAHACSPAAAEVREWSISHVVDFVRSIDLCKEYAQVFQDHSIDGSTLPLLTEEHLITNMNMKLGPALKLRSVLAKKIGHCAVCLHCVHCHAESTRVTPSPSLQDHKEFNNA